MWVTISAKLTLSMKNDNMDLSSEETHKELWVEYGDVFVITMGVVIDLSLTLWIIQETVLTGSVLSTTLIQLDSQTFRILFVLKSLVLYAAIVQIVKCLPERQHSGE